MNPDPREHPTLVAQYLEQLSGVQPATKACYGAVLHHFQSFVPSAWADDPVLTLEALRQWLQNRMAVWPVDTLMHRLCMVDRFLDWLTLGHHLPRNPLADLRETYGRHNRRVVVRALLSTAPQQALEHLRPLPRFGSHLGAAMQDHLTRMRTLGYRYERDEYHLLRFDRYLQTRLDASAQPLHVLVDEWAVLAANPLLTQQRLGMGRALARSLRRTDATVANIPRDRALARAAKHQQRSPHIYSEEDIRQLLTTARQWASPHAPLRPRTLEAMLALAYGAGLRLGELVRLTLGDLDLQDATIEIRETKFFKSRRLPLATTVMTTLRQYVAARRQAGASEAVDAALFWNEQHRRGYAVVTVEHLLTHVIRQAGLKPAEGRSGPRVHDLRHTFVVHRMLAWYHDGVNPQQRLHHLATWLGHKDINSTLVYLTITQELLQEASLRFHAYGAQALQTQERGASCH